MTNRPNVLFITVDQWPAHLMGGAGHPAVETPTLDTLARSGTRFDACYSECPICIPARRSIMTGMTARGHGDRDFQPSLPMPEGVPTLAGVFAGAGYQAFATGKLHVYPMRDRIGFHDVLSAEEGRSHLGGPDDYEIALADRGHAGAQFLHGMSNNEYSWTPWHLEDDLHVTSWTARMAARQIRRRDPTRPGFWYVSFTHPHPPLAPLASYVQRYAGRAVPQPAAAEWQDNAPWVLRSMQNRFAPMTAEQMADMRRAYYALATHIDHQLRLVIGALREEGILDNTIILFTADHGEMLGDFGIFGKRVMFDASARVPLILVDTKASGRIARDATSDALVGLQDIMPTLLDLAGIDCPGTVEGRSVLADRQREEFYGECQSGARAVRMLRSRTHKLIWYPAGNRLQLFDMIADPQELHDLANCPEHADVLGQLSRALVDHLYGEDQDLIAGGCLGGLPEPELSTPDNRGLSGQRGPHFPQPPSSDPSAAVGAS
ncbi:sulfatase-like hydrolase/transferase [Salipiger sp. PrR002]|uniref:sulfatase-like hydrolase/transferase n=1 Tax=Salipiger sp. PrR002 TaxID=2706489 RepID=UPI0013BCA852|nr:sulfatase-like hydrolase/transferase [Salipiger sp. PrR002]NDW01753.1 sulfatase-like hydrolase/transferase [Salipiger sp. PrR002]NDW57810.1 sulfatase-like hydrolase/transferase [Salipiger sp. PrR004]